MANPDFLGRQYRAIVGPVGQQGRQWDNLKTEGLRVRFEVSKSGDATPNKIELWIYNLSSDSRNYVEGKGKDWAVQLYAGYETTGIKLLFTGSLILAGSGKRGHRNHHHQGSDWVTEIEGRDGSTAYKNTILADSFGPNTSEDAVIRHIAKQMGITVGKLEGMSKTPYNHGRALSGSAKSEMDAMCRSRKLRWSIQDGILQILPIGQAIDSTAFLISPGTGLIGSPEVTERGVKFTSLLQGGINPGKLVQLDSQDLKGTYIAENVHHLGDTHDYPWYTEVEAIRLS